MNFGRYKFTELPGKKCKNMVKLLIRYHSITQTPKRQTHFAFSPKTFCLQGLSSLHGRCIVTFIWGKEKRVYNNVGMLVEKIGLSVAGSQSAVSQHTNSELSQWSFSTAVQMYLPKDLHLTFSEVSDNLCILLEVSSSCPITEDAEDSPCEKNNSFRSLRLDTKNPTHPSLLVTFGGKKKSWPCVFII